MSIFTKYKKPEDTLPEKKTGDQFGDLQRLAEEKKKKRNLELVEAVKENPAAEIAPTSLLENDTENKAAGIAKENNLDSQKEKLGNPTDKSLDDNISKETVWIAKDEPALDSSISKEKSLDSQKDQKKGKWTKYEKARSTVPILIRTSNDLVKEIKHFNVENNFDMREFFELAARAFLDGFGNPNASGLDIKSSLNNKQIMMLYKTKPDIISLYLKFNPKKKWKLHDDKAAAVFNDIDLRVIELGILQTLGNVNFQARVNSFAYFAPEIQMWIDNPMPEEALETVLKVNREKWLNKNLEK